MKLTKKCRTDNEVEDLKVSVFNNILMQTAGDMTRFIRNIKSIVGTDYQDEFLEEQKELAANVLDHLPAVGHVNTLLVNLRFLDVVLSRFDFVPVDGSLAVDGAHIYYDPLWVLRRYK